MIVCKGMGYKRSCAICTCGRGRGRIAELQEGLKQVLAIRNKEVSRLREVADTFEPKGKSIGPVQNWPY